MKIMYVERSVFRGTIVLPPGCVCLIFDPDEGHLAEGIIGGLMQMDVTDEHRRFLAGIYERVRVTHEKSEEN